MINWKVRIKNKWFWITIIPLILLLVQQMCAMFGMSIDLEPLKAQVLEIIETVFLILGTCGVVVDMTTEGISDSERAMTYEMPYPKHAKESDETE